MERTASSISIHALVVDDDPNVRDVVCRLLTRQFEGLRVTQATNGLEALDKLSRESFAIALLDLTMPLMDGFDVLETVRRDPALRRVLTPGPSTEWRWVPQWVEHCPPNVSHGLCDICHAYYYARV